MEPNDLIDRYIAKIGENLPQKNRDDIKLELQSLLYDDLEERAGGKEPTLEMTAEMLREFGNPETIAAQYQPERYLIGPQLFPIYRLVVTVVTAVIGALFLIPIIITLYTDGFDNVLSWLPTYILDAVKTLLMNFGGITLGFGIVERLKGERLDPETEEDWDPYKLEAVENRNRIDRPHLIAEIVLAACGLIIFNFFPSWFGMVDNPEDARVIIPILTPEFLSLVPWLSAYWVLNILYKVQLLRQGSWRQSTRWMEFGVGVFGLFVDYLIITGGPITTISWLNPFIRFGIAIGLIVGVFESISQLYKILRPPQSVPESLSRSQMA